MEQKLTEEEAQALEQQQRQASSAGASAWNNAGTFEERSAAEWAKQRLKELLPGASNSGVSVSAVTSVSGDAHIWCA